MGQNLGKKSFESNVKISNEDIDLDNESAEVYEYKTNHHDLDFDNDLDKDLDKDLEIVFDNEDNTKLYHKTLDNDLVGVHDENHKSDINLGQLSEYQK